MDNLDPDPYQGCIGRATKYTAWHCLQKHIYFKKNMHEAKPLLEAIIKR